MKAVLLVLALAPQEDSKIAEWIRELGDDAIEVRERALAELVRAGRRAERALREALRAQNGEVRGRAAQVLAEIEKGERIRLFEPPPARISLKKKEAPLREVLAELQKQTATRIATASVPEDAKVTVEWDGVSLFEAVDSLCRAAGKLSWTAECRRDESVTVTVSGTKFAEAPRLFKDQYFVRLEGLQLTTAYDFRGGGTSKTRMEFRWGWEKGTRPQMTHLRIEEMTDDLGNEYAGELAHDVGGSPLGFASVQTQRILELEKVPPERAAAFVRIKGSLDLAFPESLLVFPFEKPEETIGQAVKRENATVKLLSCSRDKTRLRARIEVSPAELGGRLEMKAVDKEARAFAGRYTRGEQVTEEAIVMSIEFVVPAASEIATLRFQSPSGFREKKIPFEFKNVRFR